MGRSGPEYARHVPEIQENPARLKAQAINLFQPGNLQGRPGQSNGEQSEQKVTN